jgi:hypothetical protein
MGAIEKAEKLWVAAQDALDKAEQG